MWPFNEELILKLAEKEWLGNSPLKPDGDSEVVLEAQKILALIIGQKQQTPRAAIRKVFHLLL